MSGTIILRFRDLVTEVGGTIAEHQALLQSQGQVWWGWWMRQHEILPRQLFADLLDAIEQQGPIEAFVLDTGTDSLYSCRISDIRVSPTKSGIGSPDPDRSPEYYNRGRYPAWFLLTSLSEVAFDTLRIILESLPTKPGTDEAYPDMLHQPVPSLEKLRNMDATLWLVKLDSSKK
jgi:hypothetical protein